MISQRRTVADLGRRTLAARFITYLLGGVASVMIARTLGPEGRGHYYLPVALATVAFYVGNMGVEQAQFRLWSARKATRDEFVASGLVLAFLLGILAAVGAWAFFLVSRHSLFRGVGIGDVLLPILTLPLQIHTLITSGLLIVSGRLERSNLAYLAGAIVQTTGVIMLFVTDSLTVLGVLAIYAGSIVVTWLVMFPALRVKDVPRRPIPWGTISRQLKIGAQIQPYLLFAYLVLRIDVFFVARYRGLRGVGLYSIAVLLSELIWLVTDSLTYSVVERQANANVDQAVTITVRAVRMNLILALVGIGVLSAAGPFVIPLLYGPRFVASVPVMFSLLPAAVAMAIWRPVGALLVREAKPWLQSFIALVALIINVGLNVALIPRIGIVGAGLASSLSYGTGALLAVWWLHLSRSVTVLSLLPTRVEIRSLLEELSPRRMTMSLFRRQSLPPDAD